MTVSIPDNVDYRSYGQKVPPRPRDCEDASFKFIGDARVVLAPGQELWTPVGMAPLCKCN